MTSGISIDIGWPNIPASASMPPTPHPKTDRPFIPSEYAHAMGNSSGNFQDYWNLIEKYDNLQGGFIWDWVDQSIWKTNAKGERYYAYGGDYGTEMPSDNTFLNNGIVFPDRNPQPALYEVKKAHEYINFKNKGINKIIVISLYPHNAMATTITTEMETRIVANKVSEDFELTFTKPFFDNEIYINAIANTIKPCLEKASFDKIIFSYHGIPKRQAKKTSDKPISKKPKK